MKEMYYLIWALIVLCLIVFFIVLKDRKKINFNFNSIIFGNIKEIRGNVLILRSQKKRFCYFEDETVPTIGPVLIFRKEDRCIEIIPISKENYDGFKLVYLKGQDMILFYKNHFLFGGYPTKFMVKPLNQDEFIEFNL